MPITLKQPIDTSMYSIVMYFMLIETAKGLHRDEISPNKIRTLVYATYWIYSQIADDKNYTPLLHMAERKEESPSKRYFPILDQYIADLFAFRVGSLKKNIDDVETDESNLDDSEYPSIVLECLDQAYTHYGYRDDEYDELSDEFEIRFSELERKKSKPSDDEFLKNIINGDVIDKIFEDSSPDFFKSLFETQYINFLNDKP